MSSVVLSRLKRVAELLNAKEPPEFSFIVVRKEQNVCLLQPGDPTRAAADAFSFRNAGLAVIVDEKTMDARIYCYREPYAERTNPKPPPPAHTEDFGASLKGMAALDIASLLESTFDEMDGFDQGHGITSL